MLLKNKKNSLIQIRVLFLLLKEGFSSIVLYMVDQNPQSQKPAPSRVHGVLARSYGTYFVCLLVGIILDAIFPIRMLPVISQNIGMGIIIFGTGIIMWAQSTSAHLEQKKKKGETVDEDDFHRGPYRFSRSPTHVGLNLLFIGVGFLFNSVLIVVMTMIPFLISRFVFLRKMEMILEQRYHSLYKNYKEIVKRKL